MKVHLWAKAIMIIDEVKKEWIIKCGITQMKPKGDNGKIRNLY
jgi:hypothetical protein